MSEPFDPYHVWLGIPPKDQPANHYRLLAIDLFESNREVIRDAAEQRMAHVRTYQLGPHAPDSQKILNELATARACLLDPKRKAVYDDAIRGMLPARLGLGGSSQQAGRDGIGRGRPRASLSPILVAVAACLLVALLALVWHIGSSRPQQSGPTAIGLKTEKSGQRSSPTEVPGPIVIPEKAEGSRPAELRTAVQPQSQPPAEPKNSPSAKPEPAVAQPAPAPEPVVLQPTPKAQPTVDAKPKPAEPDPAVVVKRLGEKLDTQAIEGLEPSMVRSRIEKRLETVAVPKVEPTTTTVPGPKVEPTTTAARDYRLDLSGDWLSKTGNLYRLTDNGNTISMLLLHGDHILKGEGTLVRNGNRLTATEWRLIGSTDPRQQWRDLRFRAQIRNAHTLDAEYEWLVWDAQGNVTKHLFPLKTTWKKVK